jgi:hypothetical protein
VNLYVSPSVSNLANITSFNILKFAKETFGKRYEQLAWNEFLGMAPEDYEEDHIFMEVFIPWYLYSWHTPDRKKISLEYAVSQKLTMTEEDFVQSASRNIFSFYQILEVGFGHYLKIRDLISNEVTLVFEKMASTQLQKGDIIFSKIGQVHNLSFLLATTSVVIPQLYGQEILRFGRKRKIHKSSEFERMILYYSIIAEVLADDLKNEIPLSRT